MFKHFPFIHNHGDFVHLDALRDWLRGTVSLESFLQSKNDKAIVKDIHFTDERTTVDYIDTKDDTENTETLCEYLTSDVYDKNNPNQLNKVDKITMTKDSHGENWVNVREKATKEQRLGVIQSNVPVAYDATDDYQTSPKIAHIGLNNRSINIYDDNTLKVYKKYSFANPIAYNVTDDYKNAPKAYYLGVNNDGITIFNNDTQEVLQKFVYGGSGSSGSSGSGIKKYTPTNYRYFTRVLDETNPIDAPDVEFTQSYIELFAINNKVISAQAKLHLTRDITIASGDYKVLHIATNNNGNDEITSDFAKSELVFPKIAKCFNDAGIYDRFIITSINKRMEYNNNSPITNGNFLLSLYNPTNQSIKVNDFVIVY